MLTKSIYLVTLRTCNLFFLFSLQNCEAIIFAFIAINTLLILALMWFTGSLLVTLFDRRREPMVSRFFIAEIGEKFSKFLLLSLHLYKILLKGYQKLPNVRIYEGTRYSRIWNYLYCLSLYILFKVIDSLANINTLLRIFSLPHVSPGSL